MCACENPHPEQPWFYRNRREAHLTLHVIHDMGGNFDMATHPGPVKVWWNGADAVKHIKRYMKQHPTHFLVTRNRRPSTFVGAFYKASQLRSTKDKKCELYWILHCGRNFEWTFVATEEAARAFLCTACDGDRPPVSPTPPPQAPGAEDDDNPPTENECSHTH